MWLRLGWDEQKPLKSTLLARLGPEITQNPCAEFPTKLTTLTVTLDALELPWLQLKVLCIPWERRMTPNRWRPLEFKLDSDVPPLPANEERGGRRMKGPAACSWPQVVALGTHGCPGLLGFHVFPAVTRRVVSDWAGSLPCHS